MFQNMWYRNLFGDGSRPKGFIYLSRHFVPGSGEEYSYTHPTYPFWTVGPLSHNAGLPCERYFGDTNVTAGYAMSCFCSIGLTTTMVEYNPRLEQLSNDRIAAATPSPPPWTVLRPPPPPVTQC